jgi:ATP-binding cassette subfamily F protein uup
MDNFSYDFQPGERIGIIGKMERKINLLNLLTDLPLDGGKVVW